MNDDHQVTRIPAIKFHGEAGRQSITSYGKW